MESHKLLILAVSVILGIFHLALTDGQADHGDACSLRSQVANFFRDNDSPQGCMSSKGLVCISHKCSCADPSNIYERVDTSDSSSGTSASAITSKASSFLKNLVRGSTTTTTTSAPTVVTDQGGKCVGRAGSPCFTQNSTCVKHAVCEGTPRVCKCQGIYSSNAQGMCSKTASVVSQVIKSTVG